MTVAVLTDSAASLPPRLAERLGITVLPLGLVVGGEQLRDGELSTDQLLARLGEGVSTAGASAGEVAGALKARLDEPGVDAAAVLTVSAAMSSTYGAARLGAASLGEGGPGRVEVLDTGTAAGAQGLVVVAAAESAASGVPLDEVVATAEGVAGAVRLVATIDSLDHLVRSGRVPGIAGWAGRHLGVQPLFEFRRGRIFPLRPAFSQAGAIERIVDRCHASRPPGPPGARRLRVAVLHAMALDRADELLARVADTDDEVHSFVADFSTVMVAHTGPGLAGLAWWWDEPGDHPPPPGARSGLGLLNLSAVLGSPVA